MFYAIILARCAMFILTTSSSSVEIMIHTGKISDWYLQAYQANLQVNLEKSHFLDTQVEFLGYVVTADGIKADPKKVKAIGEMPPPTSVKELKRFLGMTSYYRKFIQDYAKVAKPLTNLTRGLYANIKSSQSSKVPITLDETAIQSFKDLKSILSSSEILAFPCFTKPFHLTTDASNYAIGAVL